MEGFDNDLKSLDEASTNSLQTRFAFVQWKTMSRLESYSVRRRYQQANLQLLNRVWLVFLGFVTGMILALVGATFILGKITETESRAEGQAPSGWKVSLVSASPGLFLCFLGTVLMITTICSRVEIAVDEKPLYLQPALHQPQQPESGSAAHDEAGPLNREEEEIIDDAIGKIQKRRKDGSSTNSSK